MSEQPWPRAGACVACQFGVCDECHGYVTVHVKAQPTAWPCQCECWDREAPPEYTKGATVEASKPAYGPTNQRRNT